MAEPLDAYLPVDRTTSEHRNLSFRVKRRIGYAAAGALERLLRLTGPDNYRFVAARLHAAVYKDGFELASGLRCYPDPCSVGRTPQGEMTGASAADLVRTRDRSDLAVLDICCGIGLVGLSMLVRLRDESRVKQMSFADINIFNINSVKKTLARADPARLGNVTTETFLSDQLASIPASCQFDIIVSNPPHFDAVPFSEGSCDPVELGNADPSWEFHRNFYRSAHKYLKPGGEVWFFENGEAASVDLLLPFIMENPELEFVESFVDGRDSRFFWMITRRFP